jgi:hypothetical protein
MGRVSADARPLERDAAVNAAEYLSEWRSDLEAFVSREVVRSCVDAAVYERLPVANASYDAFIDPAGGSGTDSMTLAISHREQSGMMMLDALREWRPPFNPTDVINEAAQLLKCFGVCRVDRLLRKQRVEIAGGALCDEDGRRTLRAEMFIKQFPSSRGDPLPLLPYPLWPTKPGTGRPSPRSSSSVQTSSTSWATARVCAQSGIEAAVAEASYPAERVP